MRHTAGSMISVRAAIILASLSFNGVAMSSVSVFYIIILANCGDHSQAQPGFITQRSRNREGAGSAAKTKTAARGSRATVLFSLCCVRGSPAPPALEGVMTTTLKMVLIVVDFLAALGLVAPFLIPVNQFRPTIEEKASA